MYNSLHTRPDGYRSLRWLCKNWGLPKNKKQDDDHHRPNERLT